MTQNAEYDNQNHSRSEHELYAIEANDTDVVAPYATAVTNNNSYFDDWTLARTLQALEFEISNEEIAAEAIEGDFNAKEYSASRSCKRQLMTFSFLICLIQVFIRYLALNLRTILIIYYNMYLFCR